MLVGGVLSLKAWVAGDLTISYKLPTYCEPSFAVKNHCFLLLHYIMICSQRNRQILPQSYK